MKQSYRSAILHFARIMLAMAGNHKSVEIKTQKQVIELSSFDLQREIFVKVFRE